MTPLVRIELVVHGVPRPVQLKLEGASAGGSLKDRTARGLVRNLERRGALRKAAILVESTSGNLGVSLALVARTRGYGLVAVVDPKTTAENLARMHELGARIELVDRPDAAGGYLASRLARVRELCASSERFVWPNQYDNAANPRAHETETGPELYVQMRGRIDAVFVAVSTGGTLAGVGRFLRRVSPATRLVAVDARGSVALGGVAGPRLLTGIGASRRSRFLAADLYDERILVGDEEAFSFCHALRERAGLSLGGSSGAVVAAAGRYLERHPEARRCLCLCADGGERYASSIFSDGWLARHGLRVSATRLGPVEEILAGRERALTA